MISTPPKCGTTWMQMLCALLIFKGPHFPGRLSDISPWLDFQLTDRDQVVARLLDQKHRRFIKTHTPLDGLPFDDGVRYVAVGRDPRDVALSSAHHQANTDREAFMSARGAAVGLDDLAEYGPAPPALEDPVAYFHRWVNGGPHDPHTLQTMGYLVNHLRTFWEQRQLQNVAVFHYADLKADLPGQLALLARFLEIDVSTEQVQEFAAAASFEQMKRRAEQLTPSADKSIWRSTEGFFHKGTSGQWRDVIDQASLAHYKQRLADLATPEFARWLHEGSTTTTGAAPA